MRKILTFGNSGSGKSILAKKIVVENDLSHLDLDSLTWLPEMPPQKAPLAVSENKIHHFIKAHAS